MAAEECRTSRDEHKLSGQVEPNEMMLSNTKVKTFQSTFPQLMLKRW